MTTMLVEAEIYVEDTGLSKALVIEGDDVYTSMFFGKTESCEIADRLDAVVDGRRHEAYVMEEGQDSLTIEEYKWMEVRIDLNGVRGILDRQAVREITHDLRYGWEGSE